MDPFAGLCGYRDERKYFSYWSRTPDRPASNEVLCQLQYSGPLYMCVWMYVYRINIEIIFSIKTYYLCVLVKGQSRVVLFLLTYTRNVLLMVHIPMVTFNGSENSVPDQSVFIGCHTC